jgi:hypothetical protein
MALNWQTASRESAKLVPLAQFDNEARVQIYCAKAFSWRGKFSVHTWLATKEKNAETYLVYHVLLWGSYYGDGVVSISKDLPDRYWYGAKPEIIFSIQGKKAEVMIPKIYAAVKSYPYQNFYRAYPGPNSNSFISYIMRKVGRFYTCLPSNAIGKDWLCDDSKKELKPKAKFFSISESGTGIQFSCFGMIGFIFGLIDGIEINIIGLSFGIDLLLPAFKLPIIGRIGFKKIAKNKII